MEQGTLFDPVVPEAVKKTLSPFRCKECDGLGIEEYRSGRRFFYCLKKTSRLTGTGFKKISYNLGACEQFKKREGDPKIAFGGR